MTFTARAAGRAARPAGRPSDVGGRAGAHLPRRGDAPAALLRPPGARRPDAGAGREQAARWWRRRPPASRLSTDRTSLRDLASEIEWAKTTLATPEDYPARAKAAGREPPFEAAAVAAVYASYESAKQRDGALDFEDLLLVTAYALEEHPRRRPRGARAVPALRRRRVPGRQPAAAAAARRLARRPGRGLRRRRPQPDDLLLHRRRPRLPARLRRPLSRRRAWSSSSATTAPRRRWSALANRLIGQAPRRKGLPGLRLLGQRADGPEPTFVEHPDEPAEAAAVAGPLPGADRRRHCRRRRSPCCSGSTPSRRSTSRRWPTSACRTCSRAASGSSSGPRSARRCCCCAGRPPAAASPARWSPTVRDVLASTGWAEHRPPAGGAARDRWQSLAALVDLAVDLVAENPTLDLAGFVGHLAERADAQHAPTVQGVTLASMHAAKGLEWDAVFVVGLVDGVVPIAQSLSPARGGRGGAPAALRRGDPGPRAADAVLVAGPQPRAPSAPGRAAASSPASRPESGPTAPPARAGRRRSSKVVLEGEAGRAVRAAAGLAQPGGPVGVGAGLRGLHRRDAAGDRRDPAGEPARSCPALPGIGARKLDLYGEDVLADRQRLTVPGTARTRRRQAVPDTAPPTRPEDVAVNSLTRLPPAS